ncbi:MAG: MFS transporter [Rickettsiales bacterium]|nr:MFS transporter [Rickettsiales bacterium]
MLYVHMAVLLNELFFPKTDPETASILSAFAFCSTFVFRPFGALIFGWLGDNISRKATVVITTVLMAFSCILMANLPTYSQIGIAASWLITICRILQGMSSVGEIVGAELYLTEITTPPIQYPIVSFIAIFSVVGTVAALAVASLFTSFGLNWRIAFWIGAAIAMVGAVARTALRETPEFADAKRRLKKRVDQTYINSKVLQNDPLVNEKANKKTTLYLFLVNCAWPACFYFAYVHCGNILKNSFGYNAESVIHHNLIISIIQLAGLITISLLSYKIYPLKILKTKLVIFSIGILGCPYLLQNTHSTAYVFIIQSFIVLFAVDTVPAVSIFFKHFPVFKRFTYTSLIYAISRALMYIITSFGIIYLTKYFGHYGLLIVIIPLNIGCVLGINHFENLEKEAGNYPQKPSAGLAPEVA